MNRIYEYILSKFERFFLLKSLPHIQFRKTVKEVSGQLYFFWLTKSTFIRSAIDGLNLFSNKNANFESIFEKSNVILKFLIMVDEINNRWQVVNP